MDYRLEAIETADQNMKQVVAYSASFRNLELKIWELNGGYLWSVTNSTTGEVTRRGEATDPESAMVDTAEAAEADWGSVRWRGSEEDDQ